MLQEILKREGVSQISRKNLSDIKGGYRYEVAAVVDGGSPAAVCSNLSTLYCGGEGQVQEFRTWRQWVVTGQLYVGCTLYGGACGDAR